MEGLSNPRPTHKVRSEFLAMLWFAHLMSDRQINEVIDNKIEELDGLIKLIGEFMECDCEPSGAGSAFVAGFGRHVAGAIKQYIKDNRHILTDEAVKEDVKVACYVRTRAVALLVP